MSRLVILLCMLLAPACVHIAAASGIYQHSVALTGFVSTETGKVPTAYLWIPEGCSQVKAALLAQQNMTEEQLYKNNAFRQRMARSSIALVWVAPWFSQNWDPQSGCQSVFEEMMAGLADQSGHRELERVPIIPFGHSAQATFPWNFAAWNPDRTLCIISFHGDAPRTNLCGYGKANVEWGRQRNIDGIPGLMIEGEYEWWEARVRPALAFRMMYPDACISFLCDTEAGHFELQPETAEYIALFIEKAMAQRLLPNGALKRLNPRDGWLACRFNPDFQPTDGDGAHDPIFQLPSSNHNSRGARPLPAPFSQYEGDPHDAFWYFDREMALLTETRYAATHGKTVRDVGKVDTRWSDDEQTLTVSAPQGVRIEVICGSLKQAHASNALCRTDEGMVFQTYPYECGTDNPKRSYSAWLVAVRDGDAHYKRAVKPFEVKIPH